MLHIDGDDRHVEGDLVEDEIVADGIDGLLIARDLRRKQCGEVVDGVLGLYGATTRSVVNAVFGFAASSTTFSLSLNVAK